MKFPYFLAPGEPRDASVPLVKVVYKNNSKRTTPLLALVDSGASVSFAPLDLALWLGVKVENKKGKVRRFVFYRLGQRETKTELI